MKQSQPLAKKGIGEEIAQIEAGEALRSTLKSMRLYRDKKSPYTKEGLRSMEKHDKGDSLGYISGVFIKKGWKENKRALSDLGNGMLEYDEYIVENKSIPIAISNLDIREDENKKEYEDIRFIPAKYCPFRYAEYNNEEGNVQIKCGGNRKVKVEDLGKPHVMEAVMIQKITAGERIVIKIG